MSYQQSLNCVRQCGFFRRKKKSINYICLNPLQQHHTNRTTKVIWADPATGHTKMEKAYKHFSTTCLYFFSDSTCRIAKTFLKKINCTDSWIKKKKMENILINFLFVSTSSSTWIDNILDSKQTLAEQAVVDSFNSMLWLQSSKSQWEIKFIISS